MPRSRRSRRSSSTCSAPWSIGAPRSRVRSRNSPDTRASRWTVPPLRMRGGHRYAPSMNRVRTGELPWTTLDRLHRTSLDRLLPDFGVTGLSESETDRLNQAWHRLRPWPDSVAGLTRLKRKFIIAPLSNGNISLMTRMAKHAGLPWDCILGAELARHYKPDPEVYQSAADFLDLAPGEVLMVAAHLSDLPRRQGRWPADGVRGQSRRVRHQHHAPSRPDRRRLRRHLGPRLRPSGRAARRVTCRAELQLCLGGSTKVPPYATSAARRRARRCRRGCRPSDPRAAAGW